MTGRHARLLAGLAALATTGLAPLPEPAISHATGAFTVAIQPQADEPAPAGGRPTGRLALTKTFTGALAGTAKGTMLSVGAPGEGFAAYVVVDQFAGTLAGRDGGFVMLHRGSMTGPDAMAMEVTVPAGSGTGALAGISGTMTITIRGRDHFYDLAYTLPAGDGARR